MVSCRRCNPPQRSLSATFCEACTCLSHSVSFDCLLLLQLSTESLNNINVPFPPRIHSGESYSLKPDLTSWSLRPNRVNPVLAHDGAILVNFGVEHCGFSAALARTYLLNPSTVQEAQYRALHKAFEAAVDALRPGAGMHEPRRAAKKMLKEMDQVI